MLKYLFMPRLLLFAQRRRRRIQFFSSSHLLYIFVRRIFKNLKSKKKKKNKTHSTRREFIIQQRESFDYEALIESLHLYRKWIDISKSLDKKSKWKYIYTGTVVDYPHSMSVSLVTDGLYSQFYTSVDQQAYRRKRSANPPCYVTQHTLIVHTVVGDASVLYRHGVTCINNQTKTTRVDGSESCTLSALRVNIYIQEICLATLPYPVVAR